MTQVKIVTDSSARLSATEINDLDITVVPLTVMIDGTVYADGETITGPEFMDKMAAAEALPKTSQPALGVFVDKYDELTATDEDVQILSIHMTDALSGTVHSAEQAGQISKGDVVAIDSQMTDRALGFQVITAAKMAKEGASRDEIIAAINDVRDHTKLYLTVPALDNLVAGGRLNKAVGFIGGFLNIKVVLEVIDGKITIAAKGRGMKVINKAYQDFYAEMATHGSIKRVGLSHAGNLEDALMVKEEIKQRFPDAEIFVDQTSPIIATHTGVGALAVIYEFGE